MREKAHHDMNRHTISHSNQDVGTQAAGCTYQAHEQAYQNAENHNEDVIPQE